MFANAKNKESMDELMKIIDRYTEGNYLIGKTTREEMAKDIFSLFNVIVPKGTLCDHKWVDARNIAVQSGKVCAKCHNLKA